MDIQHAPALSIPFPEHISPHAGITETRLLDYMDATALLPAVLKAKYAQQGFAQTAARYFPLATEEQLLLFSKFLLWKTLCEDLTEDSDGPSILFIKERYHAIWRGAPLHADDNAAAHVLADFRAAGIIEELSVGWRERFIEAISDYLEGRSLEAPYRQAKQLPALKDYLLIREKAAGQHVLNMLAEIAAGFVLPNSIYEHPVIQRLLVLSHRLIAWCQDYYAIEKESAENDVMNIIPILQHQFQLARKAASRKLVSMHEADLNEFATLRTVLPDFEPYDEQVAAYIDHIKNIISGQFYANQQAFSYATTA
ncbi:hypothetical protein KTO58_19595 [Chitinophaga pendula]|uniref:terpene synthase family protein n=1 Tax=Chitinophaga TaxID=79328 RepID=UPI000BAF1AD5|nr:MULTISPECIES: hypothetical protein [Chitinophaga]ASZ11126.1 hypothetical protein CK934_09205 [Chitinophaga sp. MD30]UCJ05877.1 hypothetical protein KTO58_19595 [Chitinophaga pendula]